MRHRLHALDWMRGIAMILMATDHASAAFNSHRLVTDSVFFYQAGQALPTLDFLYRWASHLCAPTFLFLAGVSLALSVHRRRASGVSEARIDRDLLLRGLLIVLVDLTIISWLWLPGSLLLQVMFAIGASMILMIPARRLSAGALIVLALFVIAGSETLLSPSLVVPSAFGPASQAILFGSGMISLTGSLPEFSLTVPPKAVVLAGYPLMPWWAMMVLGWVLGGRILRWREQGEGLAPLRRLIFSAGAASLVLFGIVRGFNAYGNMRLLREGDGLVQWLHVSKYPPSVSFIALELGIMLLLLGLLFIVQERLRGRVRLDEPVLVFGQTAFFFYLAHILILEGSARVLGVHMRLGLGASLLATLGALIVLYPLCRWYRAYKAARPDGWVRFF